MRDKVTRYFDFLLVMTIKEIKARYKSAVLGFLWMFLNPLLQMIIIGLIFSNFIKVPINNYFLFLFPGLLAWNFFSYSITKATPSIVYERTLIQKSNFPREAIPLSIVLSNFFHFLISICLFIFFLIIIGNFKNGNILSSSIYLFFSIFWLLIFTCGVSLLSSSLNVRFRDVNFFIQALVLLWFYATPVIFSLRVLPSNYLWIFQFNPLTYIFEIIHNSLINTPFPQKDILLSNLVLSIIIVILGFIVFMKNSQNFSDWL
ncbi:ABC transporter permease [Patescibacteria group bacterium]|nr:ABC transporter permease [Patescibacteria group bacterium]